VNVQREAAINLSQPHPNSGAVSGETVSQILSQPNHLDKYYVHAHYIHMAAQQVLTDEKQAQLGLGHIYIHTGVPGGKDNILGGHSIGQSKQKTLYKHASYSKRFPR
jgi:hypothetical protein